MFIFLYETNLSLVITIPLEVFNSGGGGNIFSVWDRLFGTYSNVEDQKSIVYGIDTHMNKKASSSLKNLLMMPFNKLNKINNSKFSK